MCSLLKKTVTIYCRNNKVYKDYPLGTSLQEIYTDMNIQLPFQVVAARVNYKVESLNFLIYKPKDIEFIDASTSSGMRVYERSLCMVLAKAVEDLYPGATLRIEHPISNGDYCNLDIADGNITEEHVSALRNRMKEIIAEDLPIEEVETQTAVVTQLFRERKQMDKVFLLETLGNAYTRYFRIGDFVDYYNSILVPSTGYLKVFELQGLNGGILLQMPSKSNPNQLMKFIPQPKLFEVFKEFLQWNKIMGLSNVGDFNVMAKTRNIYQLIKISEALHEKKIAQIADMIQKRLPQSKFVMISGPSSSGKTTFSKRLSIQLMVTGVKPIVLSLDNYFVNRKDTPLDENGEWDFENLHAIDLDLFNRQLKQLLNGEEVEVPFYNFEIGERQYRGNKLRLEENSVLLIEGIHALNPELSQEIPDEMKFRIYVSTLTTISLDNHNRLTTTDTRLLRRIVRDFKFRNYDARETISRWPSVRRGEEKWIFPYQEYADVMFNSALLFELSVLRKHAEPILSDVPQYCEQYTEAHRLLKLLKYFAPIYDYEIPPTSLLREFLGGSSFRY